MFKNSPLEGNEPEWYIEGCVSGKFDC